MQLFIGSGEWADAVGEGSPEKFQQKAFHSQSSGDGVLS